MTKLQMNIIIPSSNPDERLLELIKKLQAHELGNIVIVNDGSASSFMPYFEKAQQLGCKVYHHAINLGKGRSIKTAINEILLLSDECQGFICVDSDGKHHIEDIIKVIACLSQHQNALILGTRDVYEATIPAHLRMGKRMTRRLMMILCGIDIQDIQTGLRAFTSEIAKRFLRVKGEGFDFEFHVLFECHTHHIEILQEAIKTLYIQEKVTAQFNPLRDSFQIYQVFLKFVFSSFGSAILDVLLFSIFVSFMKPSIVQYIMIATMLARVVSSIFNYILNKHSVFQSKSTSKLVTTKYFILCAVQMMASAVLVSIVYTFTHQSEALIKVIVDVGLFFISFVIQREWIFKS